MKQFIKFPSIGQFRNALKDYSLAREYADLPSNVMLVGSVKLHGTNAAICFDKKDIWFQSRNKIIDSQNDNAGFASWGESVIDDIVNFRNTIYLADDEIYTVFGEWIGNGVQKGVGVSLLDKQFVPFESAITFNSVTNYFSHLELQNQLNRTDFLHSVYDCGEYNIELDFDNPMIANNELIKITSEVESECPFAKYHGVSGVGEGVVWHYDINEKRYRFKVKGDKHSNTKVKKLNPVDSEKEQKIIDFVNNNACTASRLDQAYTESMNTINGGYGDRAKTGDFLKWLFKDIIKEESDILSELNLTSKDVTSKVALVAKKWLFEKIDSEIL